MKNRSFLRHIVFFSAKDKKDLKQIVAGLLLLKNIPHSSNFEVVENTMSDELSGEIDVVVYAEFKDEAALRAYKSDPIYQDAIDIVRPLRELRFAADF